MLVARLLEPASKLATHRMLHDDTATSSLGRVLGVGQCSADDLYRALDWLQRWHPEVKIALTTRPTTLQDKAFKLLGLNPACTQ